MGPNNVIGEAAQTGVGGVVANLFARATTSAASSRGEAFSLGERAAILHHLDQAALIPHVAESEGKKFPYEVGLTASCSLEGPDSPLRQSGLSDVHALMMERGWAGLGA